MKTGNVFAAATSLTLGIGTVAVVTDWWRFLLALALLGLCAATPILHVVYGPAEEAE